MTYETLKTAVDANGVLTLTLSRPAQLNAFTVQMANELIDFLRAAYERRRRGPGGRGHR